MRYSKSERTGWRDTTTAPLSDNPLSTSSLLHNYQKIIQPIQPTNIFATSILHQIRETHKKVNLPKPQLNTYNGDPLKSHEWYCYLKSTIHDKVSLCDAQIITYVRNALTDRAKESVFGYSFNGEFCNDAMTKLKRRIGRPQFVIAAYLDKLERWPMPSTENPDSFISFAVLLRKLVQEKLSPAIMIVKRDENVIRKELVNPNMIQFND